MVHYQSPTPVPSDHSTPSSSTIAGIWSRFRTLPHPLSGTILRSTFQDHRDPKDDGLGPALFQSRMLDHGSALEPSQVRRRRKHKPIPWVREDPAPSPDGPQVFRGSDLYKLWSDMSYLKFQSQEDPYRMETYRTRPQSWSREPSSSVPSQIYAPPSRLDLTPRDSSYSALEPDRLAAESKGSSTKTEIVIKVMPVIQPYMQTSPTHHLEPFYQSGHVADRRIIEYEDLDLGEDDEDSQYYVLEDRSDSYGSGSSSMVHKQSGGSDGILLLLLLPLLLLLGLALGLLLSTFTSSTGTSTSSGFTINSTNIINITGPNVFNNITNINNNNASNVNTDNDNITNSDMGRSFRMNWDGRGTTLEHLLYFLGFQNEHAFVPYFIESSMKVTGSDIWTQMGSLSRKASCMAHAQPPLSAACVTRVICEHLSDDFLTYNSNLLVRMAEIFWVGLLRHLEQHANASQPMVSRLNEATEIINIASRESCPITYECPELTDIDCYFLF